MQLAIQVVLYKSSRDLPRLLESLKRQTFQDWKLFCFENSCDPVEQVASEEILRASDIGYQLTISANNIGFTAHNKLYAQHHAPFVLVLNDDAFLAPNYLEVLMADMEAKPQCASAVGLIFRCQPNERPNAPRPEDKIDTAGLDYHALGHIVDRQAGQVYGAVSSHVRDAQDIFGISGAIALYRRTAIDAVSPDATLFDPTFFMYKEDVDLALRLKHGGWTAWFNPNAVAWHERAIKEEGRGFFARLKAERKRPPYLRKMSYRNQWMIYVYHFTYKIGLIDMLKTFVRQLLRDWLTFLASPTVFILAWIDIITSLLQALQRRARLQKKYAP